MTNAEKQRYYRSRQMELIDRLEDLWHLRRAQRAGKNSRYYAWLPKEKLEAFHRMLDELIDEHGGREALAELRGEKLDQE